MVDAVNVYRPRVEIAEIEQAFDQRRLPGSVDASQRHAATRRQIEVDPPQHFGAPEALVHSTESNQRLGHQAASRGCDDDSAKAAPFHLTSAAQGPRLRVRASFVARSLYGLEFALRLLRAGCHGYEQS